jgi:Na+/H+ antiporter NhaD/arsenite permease-like protein
LKVARRMGVPPLPYLLAVATASNIGSVATITGNPQNILIGAMSGIHYLEFMMYLGPVALLGLFLNWGLLWWMFLRRSQQRDEVTLRAAPREVNRAALVKPSVVMLAVLAAFLAGIPPALAAAVGAAAMLISRSREPRQVYDEVDWGLLVFFVGLFVIVGGAERAGLTRELFHVAAAWNLHHPAVFTVLTAALSNLVSNVPAVMLLKSLVPGFANPHTGWLLLAMASTLAGNLTITGSVANIIVVERARGEVPIGFFDYFRVGLPLTLLTLLMGSLWLAFIT